MLEGFAIAAVMHWGGVIKPWYWRWILGVTCTVALQAYGRSQSYQYGLPRDNWVPFLIAATFGAVLINGIVAGAFALLGRYRRSKKNKD